VFLGVPVIAAVLGHALPTVQGWLLALLVVPAVLLVDTAAKRWTAHRSRRRDSRPGHRPTEDPATGAAAERRSSA
jgi:hypothetical protein